jgi:UDP-N-acetylmuramate dehydrogenase
MTSLPLAAVPLSGYTTLRVGGPATRFVSAETAEEVVAAVRDAEDRLLVLGGGSNLVISDDGFDGTVVRVANRGSKIDSLGDGRVALTVEAGEDWDAVVCRTVEAGLGGLECLSGIPGSVGATPVQNVGAYGVEIAQLLISVDLLDRASGEVRTLTASELGLGYRTSMLKNTERAVVLRVRFELADGGLSAPIRYTELARVLGVRQGRQVPAADARAAVPRSSKRAGTELSRLASRRGTRSGSRAAA